MEIFDSVIIGGGPAGLTAALYLLRSGLSVLLVEKLAPGGQVLMSEEIENYPGFPEGAKGWELIDRFTAQLEPYDLKKISDEVRSIEIGDPVHKISVGDQVVGAKSIILCSGARYRPLGVPGEQEFLGRGVSYCALCDGNFYKGEEVAVVGGGNSALEESLYLARIVEHVHLIHRREEFRGEECYQNKCFAAPNMTIHRNTVVRRIQGDQVVRSLLLEDVKTKEQRELSVSGVFIFVGFDAVMDYVPEAVARGGNGILTDTEMRTNVPGIFAAGDVRSKLCRQVASAVGDGATAANAAYLYLESLNA